MSIYDSNEIITSQKRIDWDALFDCKKRKGIYGWLDSMGSVNLDALCKGSLSHSTLFELDEWSCATEKQIDEIPEDQLPQYINTAIKLTAQSIAVSLLVKTQCTALMTACRAKNLKNSKTFMNAEALSKILIDRNLESLRKGMAMLLKLKSAKYRTESPSKYLHWITINNNDRLNSYRAQLQLYLEVLNEQAESDEVDMRCGIGFDINGDIHSRLNSNWKMPGQEAHLGENRPSECGLELAQESVIDDAFDMMEGHPVAAVALAYGAAVIPFILLSPMLSRLEIGDDAAFRVKAYREDLSGLRTVFKGFIGTGVGYNWFDVDKKISNAIALFRENKKPIYMNELMWDKVKEFHGKYEMTFNEIKYLISEYREKIGPKSRAKFEFAKNNENFEAANEWLEKYVSITDDISEMIRYVMKDVNGTKMIPVTKVMSGPGVGQMYYVPEDIKTGRRVSPDIKISEKEFFDICNEDLCTNFNKTTKIGKVLGKLRVRKGPANKSMKENFESAIRDLCTAYTHYVCYIYIMCSEAYHREKN